MGCSYETREVTGAGDWLDIPEVMARAARWAGQGGAHCCWSLLMCWASLAMGLLVVVRVCFHQMWPWCWRRVVVVADDLAMACKHRRSEPMLTISAGRPCLRWIQVESCASRARKYSRSYLHRRGDEKVYRAITFDRNRAATPDHQTGR